MYANEANRIEIENWILLGIVLGLVEMLFSTGNCLVWNMEGYQSNFVLWTGVLVGVLKNGVSRCLVVMVSLGWGVVRNSLGSTQRSIVILGTVYIVAKAIFTMSEIFSIEDVNKLTTTESTEITNVEFLSNVVVSLCNAIFIIWILDALNNSIMYLEDQKQTRKLERFLQFRCLFLVAVLLAVITSVFSLVDTVNDQGIVAEEHAWVVDASTEINYLFVLIGVSWLWRPNPNAREYAYVMELPALGADGELELAGGIVPSALDDDDDEEDRFQNNGEPRFEIS